jgi:beta-mannosidase
VEAHRRSKPYNMGTLFWMMNECWPVDCGSAIDYYGRWKAVLYMLKKSFAPVFVSPTLDGDMLKVYLVNDYNQAEEVELVLDLIDFQGKNLWHHDQAVTLAPNSSKVFFQADTGDHANQYELEKVLLRARVYQGEVLLSENFQYFKPAKDLALEKPGIQATYKKVPEGYEILLSSSSLAKFVFLTIESPVGRFSDNYFDLIPGEPKKILFKTGETIENIKEKMEISSLIESYKK